MIIDKIENIDLYSGISPNIKEAIEYIKGTDFSIMETGKYNINKNMFVLVNEYLTQENKLGILEAHKSYIDFQYILEGSEVIEYELFNKQKVHTVYNSEDDYILYYNTENKSQIQFKAGMFSILFPNDLHLPGVINNEISNIRKIVLKIMI